MTEEIDLFEMGELERLEYIAKELDKPEPTQNTDESNKDFKIRYKAYTRNKNDLLKKQKVYSKNLSEPFIDDIATAIQDANPTWALMDKRILTEMIRLTIKKKIKSKGGVEAFKKDAENEEELKNKIIDIFNNNDKARALDESQIIRFNAAWQMGLNTGAKPRHTVKKLFSKLKK